MKAILFCAGFGTRLKPWTNDKAKPAIEFLDLPLMAYPLYYLLPEITELTINTHYLPETVKKAFEQLHIKPPKTQFVHETPEILNTGGTIKSLEKQLIDEELFITANSDSLAIDPHNNFIKLMIEQHQKTSALATLLTTNLKGIGTDISAVWVNDKNHIIDFGKNKVDLKAQHYAGFMILSPKIFNYLPSGASNILIDGLMPAIKAQERVYTYHRPDIEWFETGTIKDFQSNEVKYRDNETLNKIRNFYAAK